MVENFEDPVISVMVKVLVPAIAEKVPVPEYGGVPPVAETVTLALPPLQGIEPAETLITSGLALVDENS